MGKKADLFTTREIEIEMLSYLKLIDSGVNSVGLKQRSGTIPGPYQPPLPAQGLGGFQLFYPIIAPLHVGATYPALNHSTHHANRPSVDAISNVVPKQPADLYRPRYYAGGGGSASSAATSRASTAPSTGTGPLARMFELPEDGLDPQMAHFNSAYLDTSPEAPIVDTGASHHLTGDRIGSMLFPTEDGGKAVVPGVLY